MDSSSEDSALLCQPLSESLYRFRYYCKKREMATSTYIFDVHSRESTNWPLKTGSPTGAVSSLTMS